MLGSEKKQPPLLRNCSKRGLFVILPCSFLPSSIPSAGSEPQGIAPVRPETERIVRIRTVSRGRNQSGMTLPFGIPNAGC